jgi:hypothetical protein
MIVIGLVALSLQWARRDETPQPQPAPRAAPTTAAVKAADAAEPPGDAAMPNDDVQSSVRSAVPGTDATSAAAPSPVFPVLSAVTPQHAQFYRNHPSRDTRQVADWVVTSRNNRGLPFFIVDKRYARLYVFDTRGRLRGSSTILLGLARGDDTVPGIGTRKLSQIHAWERTTPAGRFVGELGRNAHGADVVWVDYDAAVSMHRVINYNPKERRLQRLASNKLSDKRISYGCINVPARFFDTSVKPALFARKAIIYVLPETKSLRQVFTMDYDTDTRPKIRRPPAAIMARTAA